MVYRIYCTPFLVYRIYYVKQCIDVAHPSWSIEFTMLNSLQILRVIINEPQPVQPDSYRERNVTFVCDCTFSYTLILFLNYVTEMRYPNILLSRFVSILRSFMNQESSKYKISSWITKENYRY